MYGRAARRTRAVGIWVPAPDAMILVGMLDLNVRVALRLQIVHEAILFTLQIDEQKYRNRCAVNKTINTDRTRLTLSQR